MANLTKGTIPPVGELLSRKESWGVIIASAVIDPIWWLFVVWIPIYLFEVYDISTVEIKSYGWIPYVGAMVGAWFGGPTGTEPDQGRQVYQLHA